MAFLFHRISMTAGGRRTGAGIGAVVCAVLALPLPARAQWQPGGNPVCTATGSQSSVAVLASQGGAIVAWLDQRGATSQVYAQRLNSAGAPAWTGDGVLVSGGVAGTSAPVLVDDGAGGAIVAWIEDHGTNDVYAQRIDGSGNRLWAAAGIPICQAAGDQRNVVIVSDGRNPTLQTPGAYLAWEDFRSDPVNADVYAQRVLSDGSVAWAANGIPVCNAGGSQTQITMVSDGVATLITNPRGVILAWKDTRTPQLSDIYAQRVDAAGTGAWTLNGEKVTTNGLSDGPCAVFLGGGNALIGWINDPNGLSDTYTQRIGTPGTWGPLTTLCVATQKQLALRGVSDGAAGAIYAWRDNRASSGRSLESDVYAQRATSTGAVRWSDNGAPICTIPGTQPDPVLVGDGQRGAIVAWDDHREGFSGSDIYAQHVDSTGAAQWTAGGLQLNGLTGFATVPAIATDGVGGAFVAWTDNRNGNQDIYATHVNGRGLVAGIGPPASGGTHLEAPFPSPSRGPTTVWFELRTPAIVSAAIYSADGRLVRALARNAALAAGRHRLAWDGQDAAGRPAPTGVYFARLQEAGRAAAARIILVR